MKHKFAGWREGEEERAQSHHCNPRTDPDRLGPGAPAAQVAHRQQEDEGGDVVTVSYEARVGGVDTKPSIDNLVRSSKRQAILVFACILPPTHQLSLTV